MHIQPGTMLLHFLLLAVSVLVVAFVLPGFKVRSFFDALGFAIVVALFNAIAWGVLRVLSLPLSVLTLGIGALIIDGLIFLGASKIMKGVEISGCFIATIGYLLVAFVDAGLRSLLHMQ
jgi:putative membrane protein